MRARTAADHREILIFICNDRPILSHDLMPGNVARLYQDVRKSGYTGLAQTRIPCVFKVPANFPLSATEPPPATEAIKSARVDILITRSPPPLNDALNLFFQIRVRQLLQGGAGHRLFPSIGKKFIPLFGVDVWVAGNFMRQPVYVNELNIGRRIRQAMIKTLIIVRQGPAESGEQNFAFRITIAEPCGAMKRQHGFAGARCA